MAVHNVIEMEIKQTKMNFFCLHFYLFFSMNSLTTHVMQKYVLEKGVRALRGYFGPPMWRKNENCFSQVSSY